MRKYIITYLSNTDYCKIKPEDLECHTKITIEANNKAEAISKLHDRFDYANMTGVKQESYNKFPEIWEVVEK